MGVEDPEKSESKLIESGKVIIGGEEMDMDLGYAAWDPDSPLRIALNDPAATELNVARGWIFKHIQEFIDFVEGKGLSETSKK